MNRYTIKGFKYEADSPMARLQEFEDKIEDRVLVEVKHGEWIEKDDGWDGVMYTCSVCRCDYDATAELFKFFFVENLVS